MGDDAGPSRKPATLRVAGAWSGLVEVLLNEWTVKDFRAEVSRRSGFSLGSIKLISAGRVLKDDQQGGVVQSTPVTLREAGVGESSKILVTRVGGEQASLINQERERSERIARVKAAADAMAKRSNMDTAGDFDIQLENQSGDELRLNSNDDRKALVLGLMLHGQARDIIQRSQYAEGLEVLTMAEEAFSLTDPKILEKVDNIALLQLDTVWCLFMLRDISRLAVAQERLTKAREGLSRSHGRNLERLRVLQGGFCPELAVYVRLELLEGVVAYHSGHFKAARKSLVSANDKCRQLQVSDEAVAQLAAMGFTTIESRRALRVSGQDIERAVDFTMTAKRKRQEQEEEDIKRDKDRKEQRRWGKTPGGKAVDITMVNDLVSVGYGRRVAAEALRQRENDMQLALDMLSDPAMIAALQISVESSQARQLDHAALAVLMSMGFDRDRATRALLGSESSSHAIEQLLQGQFPQTEIHPSAVEAALAAVQHGIAASSEASSTTESSNAGEDEQTLPELRDEEMEDKIASNLTGDPLAEYDLEVDKEGEAISEYLSLVDSNLAICDSTS